MADPHPRTAVYEDLLLRLRGARDRYVEVYGFYLRTRGTWQATLHGVPHPILAVDDARRDLETITAQYTALQRADMLLHDWPGLEGEAR